MSGGSEGISKPLRWVTVPKGLRSTGLESLSLFSTVWFWGNSQGLKWVLQITFTFHTGRSEYGVFGIKEPLKLIFLLIGPEFLFNLCGLWVLLPQTGAPLLLILLLLRGEQRE